MGISTSIRSTVRSAIEKYGSTAYLYSFNSATKTENDEGEWTISSWGAATTIKVISSNNNSYKKIAARFGIESNESDRNFLAKDNITVARQDKLTVDSVSYEITEIKKIDPIENTNMAYILTTAKNEDY